MHNPVHFLRQVGRAEALSFLLLLGIGMPMKYLLHMPLAVKILGSLHGALFVLFCVALLRAMRARRWPIARAFPIFVAAWIPFGPFLVDRRLADYEAEADPAL